MNTVFTNPKSYIKPHIVKIIINEIFDLKYGYVIINDTMKKRGINKLLADTIFENKISNIKDNNITKGIILLPFYLILLQY